MRTPAPGVIGTWAGRSLCAGDRPACKNEDVVYRFIPVEGRANLLTLLADKIIEGRRVPMGKLECDLRAVEGSATCEFMVGRTHGIWSFSVSGDRVTGALHILPERTLGREVTVHRVTENEVLAAPELKEYDGR